MRKRFDPEQREQALFQTAVELANKPGGWISLTREKIAKRNGCSEALVSCYFGSMSSLRKRIMRVARKESMTSILMQSAAANDGFAPKNVKLLLG